MNNRVGKDFLGEKDLPDTAYYGVQTLLGKENFHITGAPMSAEPEFVRAFGCVKKAAALVNRDLRLFDARIADAIVGASDRLIPGEVHPRRRSGRGDDLAMQHAVAGPWARTACVADLGELCGGNRAAAFLGSPNDPRSNASFNSTLGVNYVDSIEAASKGCT